MAVVAALGTFVAAPVASAATLTVDDDGAQCPDAQYKSVQNAIYAARAGDTIAICPGTYVEGGGGAGSNGLIIIRDVNLKGAGADLVSIRPRRTTASGSQITELTNASIRNAVGDLVMIDGDNTQDAPKDTAGVARNSLKKSLLTVNISGVTFDGDGVYAEAGIVFRDAQGSITRSRVTNIVTTERSQDNPHPGEYKGSNDGIAIASVTAPALTGDSAPLPTTPRVVSIDHTRVDKYNSTGVLFDGATGDTPPLTPSGVVTKGTLSANQIAGRTLCIDYIATGNCGANTNNDPAPQPAANGPLYGQDGVRVTAGSSATLTDNTITQNLVQGVGAPVRGAATNNANLTRAAGVRLLGAAASVFTRNNLTDNAYAVFNAQLDGTTANTAVPVSAENNWWGLRTAPVAANPGPAVSPTTNPPAPETAVNGTSVPDPSGTGNTSNAVDFFPYRNGFQSEPNTGEFPVIDVPGPVNDFAPTVTLATDAATYHRGGKATLTASPADDFGVQSVKFYDGNALVGTDSLHPYSVAYTVPSDVTCTPRTLTAVVTDSSGQTASASRTIAVDPADCVITSPGTPVPLSVSIVNAPLKIGAKGAAITVAPVAPAGAKQTDVYLGTRKACTIIAPATSCKVVPTGADVGVQTLRVVLTDLAGKTAEASTRVEVPRFAPKSLSIASKHKKTKKTVKTTFTSKLALPSNVTAAQGCAAAKGTITMVVKHGAEILRDSQVKLSRKCSVSLSLNAKRTKKLRTYTVSARFGGNTVLLPISKSRRLK